METLWQDLRYGARQLTNQPGFTAIAVLTLALGIGANVAIFNTLDALLLKTLPVERPHQLVQVLSGPTSTIFSNPLWEELRNRQGVFAGAFAWAPTAFNLALGGEVRNAHGLWVSGEYFSTLGVQSHIGRVLTPEETTAAAGRTPLLCSATRSGRRNTAAAPTCSAARSILTGTHSRLSA